MSEDYGPIHHESLEQNRPEHLRDLERRGERFRYFKAAATDATELHDRIVKQMATNHPFSETEFGTLERWTAWLNQVAREFVLDDRILVRDEETERAERDGYQD